MRCCASSRGKLRRERSVDTGERHCGNAGPPHVMKSLLSSLVFVALLCGRVCADVSFPGETIDEWHGFKRHKFEVDGCAAWVVEPKKELPGRPWSWCMEFPDA